MKAYTQLTEQERYQIYALKQAGQSDSRIAAYLGRHKSTIGWELERNSKGGEYQPEQAHHMMLARRRAKIRPRFSGSIWTNVELLL